MFDLAAILPHILPSAIAWAEARSSEIRAAGSPLNDYGIRLARGVGVVRPDLIRILEVLSLPLPDDPQLKFAAEQTGLIGPHMAGLTLGYGIYVVAGQGSNRLVSHECRHVHQYEVAGSIASFLPVYLQQIATVGYNDAPLEIDARLHERDVA
ncbi:MAG TPA: hypothetical protein VGO61_07805 [Steroidobacteraceae bacterium]|jgi:hypothetical protein|nr:hypothetical protein [Steroidobacteraceae bacterium]